MKPALQIIEEQDAYVVEISKNIFGLSQYDKAKEIKKFYTSEVKQLESTIETCVLALLDQFGIIVYDDTEESVKSAIDKLNREYGREIKICDCYEHIKEKVVHRRKGQTCIIDDFGMLSIANRVYID